MSELITTNDDRATIRWKLLTGASALALTAYVSSVGAATADDTDHPPVWIELGAQLDQVQGMSSPFTAPFLTITPTPDPYKHGSPLDAEKASRFSLGGDLNLTFQPEASDWVFSAGIRYGRSHKRNDTHHQTFLVHRYPAPFYAYYQYYYPSIPYPAYVTKTGRNANFADSKIDQSERHMIVDFQAGKDVGLGMFGHGATSVLSGGVRMARFSAHTDVNIHARPDVIQFARNVGAYHFPYKYSKFASYYLAGQAKRDFHGIGPTLSWKASVPVAGQVDDGQLSLDWGIDAALLFGRQSAEVSHKGANYHVTELLFKDYFTSHQTPAVSHSRSRNVTVPNLGASLGITYRLQDAKLSIGYRYDTFLNAMDTGIDAAKKSNVTFNGPYASISIGIGD